MGVWFSECGPADEYLCDWLSNTTQVCERGFLWCRHGSGHSHVQAQGRGCCLPIPSPSFVPHDGVGWSAGTDLQLEGWGDVEKATDSWLETHGTHWARALQGEGLQDGGDEKEQLRSCQALPEADTLT